MPITDTTPSTVHVALTDWTGFEVPDVELAPKRRDVPPESRERAREIVVAISMLTIPEKVAGGRCPALVRKSLRDPLVREEADDFIDLLLEVLAPGRAESA